MEQSTIYWVIGLVYSCFILQTLHAISISVFIGLSSHYLLESYSDYCIKSFNVFHLTLM